MSPTPPNPSKSPTIDKSNTSDVDYYRRLAAKRPPMSTLPLQFVVPAHIWSIARLPEDDELEPNLPLMFYGLGCNATDLYDFACRMDLFAESEKVYEMLLVPTVVLALRRKTGFPTVSIRHPLSTEYRYVVALYSNYQRNKMCYRDFVVDEGIRRIRKALRLPEDCQPQWFWDAVHSGTGFECTNKEYNVPEQ